MKKQTSILISLVLLYLGLKYVIPFGNIFLYPINFLVTYFHEMGHGLMSLLTGGNFISLQINNDGSGYAITSGGWRTLVLIGGYVGSAVIGNILLYLTFKKNPVDTNKILYFIIGCLIISGIVVFSSFISTIIIYLLAGLLYLISKYKKSEYFIKFIAIATIIYIISDFNNGPSSDIAKFADIFIFIPESIWKIIWLLIVIVITLLNLLLIKKSYNS